MRNISYLLWLFAIVLGCGSLHAAEIMLDVLEINVELQTYEEKVLATTESSFCKSFSTASHHYYMMGLDGIVYIAKKSIEPDVWEACQLDDFTTIEPYLSAQDTEVCCSTCCWDQLLYYMPLLRRCERWLDAWFPQPPPSRCHSPV